MGYCKYVLSMFITNYHFIPIGSINKWNTLARSIYPFISDSIVAIVINEQGDWRLWQDAALYGDELLCLM